TPIPTPAPLEEIIAYEMRGAFNFFWEQANIDPSSPGYGLVRDRYPGSPGIASIASVGFALTAYPIGIEKGYITYDQGYERASKTLDTLLGMERTEGFFYHFVDMQTGKRAWQSEVSSIDTAILMMGVLTAGEYFGGEVQTKAERLYQDVNWPWFVDDSRQMFYMAYRPEKGFEGHWDFYAEQLMLYALAAGSPTHPTDDRPYYTFIRHRAKYGQGEPFIHSWFGSLFTHQYSHAWLDFRNTQDKQGVNWFQNSVQAAQAQYEFAVNMDEKYTTLGPTAWGLSASDGPGGYNGLYGAPPSGYDNRAHVVDDTIPPYAAIASLPFLSAEAAQAMQNYYSIEALKGPYGFVSAYNLSKNWFSRDVIGIDKGITLLMLANYENDLVYTIAMKNAHLRTGLERLSISTITP
ncbi:MAG: glucoamylase family protein, partial [Anaerolineales bacterium]